MSTGFGHYPFGVGPAGQWDWTSSVLFRLAPEVYRQADLEQDNNLQKYTRGQRFSFDNLRDKIRELPSLRDPLTARSKYDQQVTLRLGPEVERLGALEQRGIDGTITIGQELTAPTGRFAFDDVGKEILVIGSAVAGNNRRVRVIRIVNSRTVLTEPSLVANAVPFQWELRSFVEVPKGIRTFQIQSGYVDLIGNGWIVTDGVRDYEVVGRRHSHWDDPIRKSFVVKEGVKGYFDPLGNVVAVTQQADTFSAVNIGQKLQTNGANPYNVGVWEITGVSVVVSLPDYIWTLTIAQSADRFPDQTDYYWALLPREELDLRAVDVPRGVAEQFGIQGQALALLTQFSSVEAVFDAEDAVPIKYLSISGSLLGNNGLYTVTAFVGTQILAVTPAFTAIESGLVWALRRSTIVGDYTQVSTYPQPVLPLLAGDFGTFVDTRESEFLQRSNVDHVGRWVNIKGHPNSYRVLGKLTGMEVEVEHLWRISQELYLQFYLGGYSDFVYERGDASPGRAGMSAKLVLDGGRIHLIDATALFVPSDVGAVVRVTSANLVPNIKLYTVDQYVSPTEVAFRLMDTGLTPDYGVLGTVSAPTIRWSLEWLYTTLEPRRPLQDDMVVDLLTDIVAFADPPKTFTIDRFCWETDFSTRVPCGPVGPAAPTLTQYFWTVTVATPFGQPGSADVVLVPDRWVFVDALGVEYGLESVPVASGPNWQFTVFGAVAPDASGPNMYLFYDCPLVLDCDFCAANWIYAEIGYGPELASEVGPAVENIYTRVLERIEQVKPAHVRILPRLVRELQATLFLTASIEPHPWLGNLLLASLSPHFDDFPADFFPTDIGLSATVEVP